MTELEKLKIVQDYLGGIDGRYNVYSAYEMVKDAIRNFAIADETDSWQDRAERAEAALAEAHERAARFEKLLKAEEARNAGEPVLEVKRVLQTLQDIISIKTDKSNEDILNAVYWLVKRTAKDLNIDLEVGFAQRPYKWK